MVIQMYFLQISKREDAKVDYLFEGFRGFKKNDENNVGNACDFVIYRYMDPDAVNRLICIVR